KKYLKDVKTWDDVTFYKAVGCDQCGGEGYRGRQGIYEVLEMDADVRKLVTQAGTTEMIDEQARKNGMATMVTDGFMKIVQGVTALEEVMRVTKE
ncbi:MAG: type II secretion system protein GspE, partial [Patescibacteria group bacterium]